jgi:hypothetical protein
LECSEAANPINAVARNSGLDEGGMCGKDWHARVAARNSVQTKGASAIDQTPHAEPKGMVLLFASGKRPNRAAMRDFAAQQRAVSISHDPLDGTPLQLVAVDGSPQPPSASLRTNVGETIWLELLRDGLTFDLQGLGPGVGIGLPKVDHRFDLELAPSVLRHEALRLIPGQHLAGAEATMPVAKALIALARDLTHHFNDLIAVVWPPARSVIGRRFFESIATAWLEGGAFPALGLTAFRETIDGALQSVGLEFWLGQELRIEPPFSSDKAMATRLGVRLINQLILIGGLEDSERVVAPDGARLILRPSRNRKFIRVWRE